MIEYEEHTNDPDGLLLLRYVADTVSQEEKQQVEEWMKENEENEKILLQIAHLYYTQKRFERIRHRDVDEAYTNVMKRITAKKNYTIRWVGVVAAVLLLLFINYGLVQYLTHSTPNEQTITLSSNEEKRVEYLLPDGTVVYLNANSSLTFPVEYASHQRKVFLTGEACFDVTHHPDKPFIVATPDDNLEVKVLGTVFNVQAYRGDSIIQTTLLEGSIDLRMKREDGSLESLLLQPLEQVSFNTQAHSIQKGQISYSGNIAWMDNKLIFKDTPLPEMIRQLSHYYRANFEIGDQKLRDYVFTGTFEDKSLEHILEYMKISSKINYKIQKKDTLKDIIVLTIKQ